MNLQNFNAFYQFLTLSGK